jgi:hypothetical protein
MVQAKNAKRTAAKPVVGAATKAAAKAARGAGKATLKGSAKAADATRKPSASKTTAPDKATTKPARAAKDAKGNGAARSPSLDREAEGAVGAGSDTGPASKAAHDSLLDQGDKPKARKPKLVRDSFTMPEDEYRLLGEIKKNCLRDGFEVKKSELLRIGVAMIREASMAELKKKLAALVPLKTGRPKKEK